MYEPPRYMSAHLAASQLLRVEASRGGGAYGGATRCVAVARLGQDDQVIVAATLAEMAVGGGGGGGDDGEDGEEGGADGEERGTEGAIPLGLPLHSLVICGEPLHPMEAEALDELYLWRGTPRGEAS